MEEAAPVEPTQTQAPVDSSASEPAPELVPDNFNIFTEESMALEEPVTQPQEAEPEEEPRKSKQFLDNLRRDKEVRRQEIELKQKEQALIAREKEIQSLIDARQKLNEDPSAFLESQGIDPMDYYRRWTEKMISDSDEASPETKISKTQKELQELKERIAFKEEEEARKRSESVRAQAYTDLCNRIEKFATSSEGYETIKENCTAADIANGMVTHYQRTGEEMTIEEAFSKIETGLRQREENFYKDPKIFKKLQKYNPEAFEKAKSPQATLSAKWKETTTRQSPEDMSYEEVREMYKGKLFT